MSYATAFLDRHLFMRRTIRLVRNGGTVYWWESQRIYGRLWL